MNFKKSLALILGATILTGGMCQTAMQVHACPIGGHEPAVLSNFQKGVQAPNLTKLADNCDYERVIKKLKKIIAIDNCRKGLPLCAKGNLIDLGNLFVSADKFVFQPISESEVKVVLYIGFDETVIVPEKVSIGEKEYTVTEIEYFTFDAIGDYPIITTHGNLTIKYVIFPNSIKKIKDCAFKGCRNLQSINLPNSITEIGRNAFAYTGIQKITIPASVTELGVGSFKIGPLLSEVTIEEGSELTYDDILLATMNIHANVRGVRNKLTKRMDVKYFEDINMSQDEHTSCSRCGDIYHDKDTVVTLPCGHRFHMQCAMNILAERIRTQMQPCDIQLYVENKKSQAIACQCPECKEWFPYIYDFTNHGK